jgi:multidrug transporter EmrE-like cation transporter
MNREILPNAGLFATQIIASVAGLMLAKQWLPHLRHAWALGSGLLQPVAMVATGAGLYALSFCLWLVILSRIELSVAYPIYIAATMLLTALGAALFLGESLTVLKTIGMIFVCAGVICLAK